MHVEPNYIDVNLALNKVASQTNTWSGMEASSAVDGLQDTESCTYPNTHVHPWLAVNLGDEYDVGFVTVTNSHTPSYGKSTSRLSVSTRASNIVLLFAILRGALSTGWSKKRGHSTYFREYPAIHCPEYLANYKR